MSHRLTITVTGTAAATHPSHPTPTPTPTQTHPSSSSSSAHPSSATAVISTAIATDADTPPSLPSLKALYSSLSLLATPPATPSTITTSIHGHLPNELHLLIFSYIPTASLLRVRSLSTRFKALADSILLPRIASSHATKSLALNSLATRLEALENEKRPHLRHYRGFLRGVDVKDISEATWYATPPEELKLVCECLAILYKGPASAPLSWPATKKTLTSYPFKTWFTSLTQSVTSIPIHSIRHVESIIMNSPSITYERLRDVSTAGYKLLILVAACLQFGGIMNEIRGVKGQVEKGKLDVERVGLFWRALERAKSGGGCCSLSCCSSSSSSLSFGQEKRVSCSCDVHRCRSLAYNNDDDMCRRYLLLGGNDHSDDENNESDDQEIVESRQRERLQRLR